MAYGGLDLVGQLDGVHDPVEELGVADVYLIATDAGRLHASRGKRDHLGIGNWARGTDQLRAHLVGLAPLLEAALVSGQDRARVAQAQGKGGRSKLARDKSRHRGGPFAD